MNTNQNMNRIAVFIDVENLVGDKMTIPLRLKPIIDRIREEGQIASMRAYGDWSLQFINRFQNEFRSNVIEMTQLSSSIYGKNTADIQLAVDALEMVLQSVSPDTVVIISGDRDFVPLVQKIKRYGKAVFGIGATESSTSALLVNACDMFLFVDDILNAAQSNQPAHVEDQPHTECAGRCVTGKTADSSIVKADVVTDQVNRKLRKAFVLLAKAISACERQGQTASENVVSMRMRQISSTFYPSRYGIHTFREFALTAEKHGYCKIITRAEIDEVIFDTSYHIASELLQDDLIDYDFSNLESAVDSYKDILKIHKRLELLCWSDRKKLVTRAWEYFDETPSEIITYDMLIGDLKLYAASNLSWIGDWAVELIVRTLSIARCFTSDDGIPRFENKACHIRPEVELDEALLLMNCTYLNGIQMSVRDVVFSVDAVAMLLYDEINDASRADTVNLFERLGINQEPKETSMSLALKSAGGSQRLLKTESK